MQKVKIMYIAIIMTYKWFTLIPVWYFEGEKPPNDNLEQGFGHIHIK